MRKLVVMAFAGLMCAPVSYPQGRPLDWPFFGGNAQRTGWEKNDYRITKENVKDFQLVLKRKLGTGLKGPRSLSPPVVIGLLISYRGFKELAFVLDSNDELWAIDADLDRIFWKKRLESEPGNTKPSAGQCPAGITAVPTLTPPTNFAARRPAARTTSAPAPAANPGASSGAILGSTGFGAPRPAFALSSDGKLHVLNTSTGDDSIPAIPFLPANSKASSLTIAGGGLYTTTLAGCGGPPAVWSIDLSGPNREAHSFAPGRTDILGLGGLAASTDGTIYVQTGAGASDPASNQWASALLALAPKDLTLQNYFLMPAPTGNIQNAGATPVIFEYQGHDLIVTAGPDGRLYLLNSQSPGGDDHRTPLFQTARLGELGESGVSGGLSAWQDSDGTWWVLAPVPGPLNPELELLSTNGPAPNGSIVAFKVEDRNGKPVLTPAWASRDMRSPQPPVITAGVVFALASGDPSSHATLYAFDGATGKEIYSTGNEVAAPANLTGMTLANGRVYFTTTDGTLYAFGIFLER
jgi:outer membrane protein assembly factor BamB